MQIDGGKIKNVAMAVLVANAIFFRIVVQTISLSMHHGGSESVQGLG